MRETGERVGLSSWNNVDVPRATPGFPAATALPDTKDTRAESGRANADARIPLARRVITENRRPESNAKCVLVLYNRLKISKVVKLR